MLNDGEWVDNNPTAIASAFAHTLVNRSIEMDIGFSLMHHIPYYFNVSYACQHKCNTQRFATAEWTVFSSDSSVVVMLQLAWMIGFRNFTLYGVDHTKDTHQQRVENGLWVARSFIESHGGTIVNATPNTQLSEDIIGHTST